MPAWGPWTSIQRLTPWVATAATMRAGVLGIPYPHLSLSVSHSSVRAASSACWWASLWASSCGSSLLLGLDQNYAAAPCASSSGVAVYPHICQQILREDRMSQIASSLCQGPQGSGPGDLLSKFMPWYRYLVSLWEVQYPTSFMVGTSASGSGLGRLC